MMLNVACINQDPGISPSRAKGAAVHLVAMRRAFTNCGVRVRAFDLPGHDEMIDALSLDHQQQPFDFIYERYALARKAGACFAREQGIPRVLEANAPLAEEAAKHRGVSESEADREADRLIFGAAKLVVSVSGAVAKYAIARGARENRVIVCPNGIDTERFHAGIKPVSLEALGVAENRFIIGFHGRERPWHGFENLVHVVGRLAQKGLPVHLLVIGKGQYASLRHLPGGCFTRVEWQAHEALPAYVAAFDVLPLTYDADAPCYFSPLKLTEAMACGVVPLVPDMGDLPKHVVHGETGLVYPAGNWDALETLIESLISDKSLHSDLGERASAIGATQGWDRIARTILRKAGLTEVSSAKAG